MQEYCQFLFSIVAVITIFFIQYNIFDFIINKFSIYSRFECKTVRICRSLNTDFGDAKVINLFATTVLTVFHSCRLASYIYDTRTLLSAYRLLAWSNKTIGSVLIQRHYIFENTGLFLRPDLFTPAIGLSTHTFLLGL